MSDAKEIMRLLSEMKSKKEILATYTAATDKLSKDLTELEQRQADEQEQKRKTDQQLASLKNEEASLRLDLEEILANEDTAKERDFNNSLMNFSITGTMDDLTYYSNKVTELTRKAETLDEDVKTLANDAKMCKREIDEAFADIAEVKEKRKTFVDQTASLETMITQLLEEKKNLTDEQESLMQQIVDAEMKQRPKAGAERGTPDLLQYDNYVKQIRAKLIEAREQKRQVELQHLEIAQRLETKRRRRELAEKRRVTDATVALMQEVYNQLSFMKNLKFCINAFNEEHEQWAKNMVEEHGKASNLSTTQQALLDRIHKFRQMMEKVRDSICSVIDQIPLAYRAELQQMQRVSSVDASGVDPVIDIANFLHSFQFKSV